MKEMLTNPDDLMRFVFFIVIACSIAGLEKIIPRRSGVKIKGRWVNNLGLVIVDSVVIKFITLATGISVAEVASVNSFGLLNSIGLMYWPEFFCALILLDLAVYWQHRFFHLSRFFWRFHRVHHSDVDFDFTTGVRFHPVEIIFSLFYKAVLIVVLGISAESFVLFEIVLNGSAIFNHSNIKIPQALDKLLRLFVVTPDMHRVHHSVYKKETNSNYGFNIPLWDYIFGSYAAQPAYGHKKMKIGLAEFRKKSQQTLMALLKQPFVKKLP